VVTGPDLDPILVKRDRYRRLSATALRIGYVFLGLAVVGFFSALLTGFGSAAVTVSVAGLIGACVVLPPAIIGGYAVKAAEREDRDAGRPAAPKGSADRDGKVH
jgi:hypothetical protein